MYNFLEKKEYLLEIEKVLVSQYTEAPIESALAGLLLYLARQGIFVFSLQGDFGNPNLCVFFPEEDVVPFVQGLRQLQEVRSPIIVLFEGSFYLTKYYFFQKSVLQEVVRLVSSSSLKIPDPVGEVSWSDEQRYAIQRALQKPFMLISGGPGTGKSFVGAAIVNAFLQSSYKSVVVTAPTGKAVAQLRERLGEHSSLSYTTLHTLLQWHKGVGKRKTPIPANLILLDEASMVSLPLFAEFLAQIGKNTHLVIMGDKNQLPPVHGGGCFAELLQANLPKVFLQKVFRNEKNSLHVLAQQTLQGEWIQSLPLPKQEDFIELLWEQFLRPWYDSLLDKELSDVWGSLYQFMILSPLRQGPWGTEVLNVKLYERVVEYFAAKAVDSFVPIVFLKNDHRQGIVNGTRALYRKERRGGKKIFMENGDTFSPKSVPAFAWGFALSIHKSQGSECDHVCLLIPPGAEDFSREIIYTGITRAKKQVKIYADKNVLSKILEKTTFHGKQLGELLNKELSYLEEERN